MNKTKAKTISAFQFLKMFDTEEKCIEFLEELRWGKKVVCVYCEGDRIGTHRKDYHCKDCRKEFNVKTNTALSSTRLPLKTWLYGAYLFMTAKKGISSLHLSKEIGTTQTTAWYLLQRLRKLTENDNNSFLSGIVEMDETYIGGKEINKHNNKKNNSGRGAIGKEIVIGATERQGNKVRAKHLQELDLLQVQKFTWDNVKNGCDVMTDEAGHYKKLNKWTLSTHSTVNHSKGKYVKGDTHTNSIESVWAVLKRGVHGTFHHISKKHLQRYLNEFTFRLSEGN